MNEPTWLTIARSDLGLKEIPGAPTAPKIAGWLKSLKAWWSDDETPWCGVAVAAWLKEAGCDIPKHWYRAKAWLEWGSPLAGPAVGCVVVFERQGGGHVGLVVGVNRFGHLMVLGGNQGNAVSIMPFDRSRVLGYRWPSNRLYSASNLPLVENHSALSTNEA